MHLKCEVYLKSKVQSYSKVIQGPGPNWKFLMVMDERMEFDLDFVPLLLPLFLAVAFGTVSDCL